MYLFASLQKGLFIIIGLATMTKWQFDPWVGMYWAWRLILKHRSPTEKDIVKIGMVGFRGHAGRPLVKAKLGVGSRAVCCSGFLNLPPKSSGTTVWTIGLVSHRISKLKKRTLPKAIA
ncbi:MAG: hypothetical protein R2822_10860 [Spirosomataceae bacterium]